MPEEGAIMLAMFCAAISGCDDILFVGREKNHHENGFFSLSVKHADTVATL
jgi:hypothetical protein